MKMIQFDNSVRVVQRNQKETSISNKNIQKCNKRQKDRLTIDCVIIDIIIIFEDGSKLQSKSNRAE